MSVWMKNLKMALEHKEVVILHGNVRDRYINPEKGLIYANLTELIQDTAKNLSIRFTRMVFYDMVDHERIQGSAFAPVSAAKGEFSDTAPEKGSKTKEPPARVLSHWVTELGSTRENTLTTVFYLDKLVSYKETGYTQEERDLILRLEKLIENITPNNRLIMVALQDSMLSIELYTNSPKTRVIPIPPPDKEDRRKYLKHRLGEGYEHLELVADLTDGLFLRDLDNVTRALQEHRDISTREIRRLINKYRIGEQEDYWGSLDIDKLENASDWFVEKQGVKGQDDAVQRVIDTLYLARAGLSGMASGTASKPRGILFFAGPTGVGKTFVAKKLASFLFNSEDAFIRFDMSEYKEEHTVSRLIGSPPGYVGYEKGGILTNAVQERPFSVILFDEIEKAHPKIMDIFLQILDEGRLTDSRGQTVFFTETVIIFTANIGTRTTDSQGRDIDEKREIDAILRDGMSGETGRREKIHRHFSEAVQRFFMFEISRPELLNRIGNNIIPFNYIDSPEIQRDIVRSHFKRIKEEFEDRFKSLGHKVEFSDSAVEFLVQKRGDTIADFGGRAITNAVEDEFMKPLSRAVLRAEYSTVRGMTFRVKAENGQVVVEG
jgi:ATP-dependent Clp protease ATP-binding subunit ClpA